MKRYPRDMIGYGPNPPTANWPNNGKIAVQFVLNYEEGSENCILHGDDSSEAFLSEIVGATAWPGSRHWNMESIYEYGARAGFWRLYRLFLEFKIPITVYGVATALARSPEQVNAMTEAHWEIASHGLKWIEHKDMPLEEEAKNIADAVRLHSEVVGERPYGWYTGRCSVNTVDLVAKEGGFEYISDNYSDDLPYWINICGRQQLIIPYTLDANDMRFATPQGFNSGDQFFSYLKDSFDALYAEGIAGKPKILSIGLHCRLVGRPGRIISLKKFIEYAQSHENVWFARRLDIARHWKKNHSPTKIERPSEMKKARFIEVFGNVFENSPWISEKAFELELGPAHDTALGIHNALSRIFRSANHADKLDVLKSHPDLAGKLTKDKYLTKESFKEQTGAGLNSLTEQELKDFEALNYQYTSKNRFPFIIAVRDQTKTSILSSFRQRINNDTLAEFEIACSEVEKIALLRIKEILS